MASRKNQTRVKRYLGPIMFGAAVLILGTSPTHAQATRPRIPESDQQPSPSKPDSSPNIGSHESEMRARLILKEEKKRYDEHLGRAREVAQLASQLSETYQAKQVFNLEDGKKLERLEKLTKRIRNEAGGSDTNEDVKDIPADTVAAVKRVAEMAEDLRKLVEKTPRHVISAAVIDQANKMIGIIQYVRNPGR